MEQQIVEISSKSNTSAWWYTKRCVWHRNRRDLQAPWQLLIDCTRKLRRRASGRIALVSRLICHLLYHARKASFANGAKIRPLLPHTANKLSRSGATRHWKGSSSRPFGMRPLFVHTLDEGKRLDAYTPKDGDTAHEYCSAQWRLKHSQGLSSSCVLNGERSRGAGDCLSNINYSHAIYMCDARRELANTLCVLLAARRRNCAWACTFWTAIKWARKKADLG
jgi:hypothetical protein